MKSGVPRTGESQKSVSEEVSDLLFQYQGELIQGDPWKGKSEEVHDSPK